MIYIVCWISVYAALLISSLLNYRGKAFYFLVVFILGAVVVLRGDVGTDTHSYESIAGLIRMDGGFSLWEPLFGVLIQILQWFTPSDVITIRLIGMIMVFGILLFLWRADRDETFFLLTVYLPAFFFPYFMNGIRAGLASIFFLLMCQARRRGRYGNANILTLAAILSHYSYVFSSVYIHVLIKRWRIIGILIALLISSIVISLFIALKGDYISNKMGVYSQYPSPSALSGAGNIISILVLLFFTSICVLGKTVKQKIILTTLFLLLLVYGISLFSYAGLRLLDLVSFVLPVVILCHYSFSQLRLDFYMKSAFFIYGILIAMVNFRGWISLTGVGLSPFLPYRFMFGST